MIFFSSLCESTPIKNSQQYIVLWWLSRASPPSAVLLGWYKALGRVVFCCRFPYMRRGEANFSSQYQSPTHPQRTRILSLAKPPSIEMSSSNSRAPPACRSCCDLQQGHVLISAASLRNGGGRGCKACSLLKDAISHFQPFQGVNQIAIIVDCALYVYVDKELVIELFTDSGMLCPRNAKDPCRLLIY